MILNRQNDQYSATLTDGRLEPASPQAGVFERIQGGVRFLSLKAADLTRSQAILAN